MNGSSRLDVELKMNLKNRRRNPTLTITHNSTQGHVSTALGQLLDRRLVHFTFFSRQVLDTGCRVLSKSSFVVVYYHRRELPQISFLSRQRFCCFCRDKNDTCGNSLAPMISLRDQLEPQWKPHRELSLRDQLESQWKPHRELNLRDQFESHDLAFVISLNHMISLA